MKINLKCLITSPLYITSKQLIKYFYYLQSQLHCSITREVPRRRLHLYFLGRVRSFMNPSHGYLFRERILLIYTIFNSSYNYKDEGLSWDKGVKFSLQNCRLYSFRQGLKSLEVQCADTFFNIKSSYRILKSLVFYIFISLAILEVITL